jgi:disulfide bond formation protein DsbB
MKTIISFCIKHWAFVALGSSVFMLAAAHAFERFGNLPPCALCLKQREAYWIAVVLALLALGAQKWRPDPMTVRAFSALLGFAFLGGAMIAGFHVGVEYRWWPGLPECTGVGHVDMSGDILGALGTAMDVPACDKVAWSFLGLSMAMWNMLVSLKLAIYSGLAALRPDGFGAAPGTHQHV